MAIWPLFMPQMPFYQGYQVAAGDNVVRGPSDVEFGSRRRRYSARNDRVSHVVPPVSVAVFRQFMTYYSEELADGAIPFLMTDPILGTDHTFYIDGLSYNENAGYVTITLDLIRKST